MSITPTLRGPVLVRGFVIALALILSGCASPVTEPTESVDQVSTAASAITATTAVSADALVNSIGVETKLTNLSGVYGKQWAGIIKPKLVALGVRHLRDEGATVTDNTWMQTVYGRMKELSAYGIKFNLIMKRAEGAPDFNQIYQWDRFVSYALPVVEDFEGLNEWDYKARDVNWPTQVRAFQQALWTKVKGDARTKNMPVFAPSMGNPNNASIAGDMSAWINYGNMHPYPGGNQPLANVPYHIARVTGISKTRPIVVTETGYHNAMAWTGGHPPVSEVAAARYIPRLFLEYYQAGYKRTYIHELMDEAVSTNDRELNFGLVRNNGSVKPAYTALQNLITVLKDPGPAFTLGQYSYGLSGDMTNVKSMLIQKRNGTFLLALWQAVPSWDLTARIGLSPASRNVTLSFAAKPARVRLFTPLTSAVATQTITAPTTVNFPVPDHVVLVEVTK